jgi:RNase H-fold protein (predicted Holliday junction resolvase)
MFKKKEIKGLVCLLVIMLVSKGWATEQKGTETKAIGTQTIEPKLIMEYKFDEPVVDVIFGEETMTVKEAKALGMKGLEKRKATEKVKVQYPKVVILGKKVKYAEDYEALHPTSIKFFNEKEKKKEVPLQQTLLGRDYCGATVIISENRKYIAVTTPEVSEEYKKKFDWEEFEEMFEEMCDYDTVIMDTEGNELWSVVQDNSYVYISPNGKYGINFVGGEGNIGGAVYINKDGIKNLTPKHWDFQGVYFSNDGTWFAVTVEGNETILTESGKYGGYISHHYLIVFDERGNELWRKENIAEGDWNIEEVSISDDNIITVITGNYITSEKIRYYFDKKGNLIEPKSKEEK